MDYGRRNINSNVVCGDVSWTSRCDFSDRSLEILTRTQNYSRDNCFCNWRYIANCHIPRIRVIRACHLTYKINGVSLTFFPETKLATKSRSPMNVKHH